MSAATPTEPAAAGFSADWLALREPFDQRARDAAAQRLGLAAQLDRLRPPDGTPWRVIDLGSGSGANLRWLAPRLGGAQEWLVVDHDAALLGHWPAALGLAEPANGEASASGDAYPPLHWRGAGHEVAIQRRRLDLATELDRLPWQAARLVSASALLDLVGVEWLRRLVAQTTAARLALLFALSVDGRHAWWPGDPADAAVAALFAAHQRRDKGFGPALGPRAGAWLVRALRARGYRVSMARSDWRLETGGPPDAEALQQALIDGMAAAACAQDPASTECVMAWQRRRSRLLDTNGAESGLRVGHVDLLALPPAADQAEHRA